MVLFPFGIVLPSPDNDDLLAFGLVSVLFYPCNNDNISTLFGSFLVVAIIVVVVADEIIGGSTKLTPVSSFVVGQGAMVGQCYRFRL